jgi:hypothetical protein
MTNWHESPLMIVKSADPVVHEGASIANTKNLMSTSQRF